MEEEKWKKKATPLILQNILLCFNPCFSKGILLQEAILGAITQEKIFERKEEKKKWKSRIKNYERILSSNPPFPKKKKIRQ